MSRFRKTFSPNHLIVAFIWLMKKEEARQRRISWEAKDNSTCDHPEIERERSDEGARTGFYVCSTCGAYIGPSGE